MRFWAHLISKYPLVPEEYVKETKFLFGSHLEARTTFLEPKNWFSLISHWQALSHKAILDHYFKKE